MSADTDFDVQLNKTCYYVMVYNWYFRSRVQYLGTHMDNVGDGPLPLSTRIPRRLSVEVELLAVEGLP